MTPFWQNNNDSRFRHQNARDPLARTTWQRHLRHALDGSIATLVRKKLCALNTATRPLRSRFPRTLARIYASPWEGPLIPCPSIQERWIANLELHRDERSISIAYDPPPAALRWMQSGFNQPMMS